MPLASRHGADDDADETFSSNTETEQEQTLGHYQTPYFSCSELDWWYLNVVMSQEATGGIANPAAPVRADAGTPINALDWVPGMAAPIHCPISPPATSKGRQPPSNSGASSSSSSAQKRASTSNASTGPHVFKHLSGYTRCTPPPASLALQSMYPHCTFSSPAGPQYRKPTCSYACLIAMALKSAKAGCLPVNEIYKFIEKEFPYFQTAPDGWKNSVRHSLSLNANFKKMDRTDGWQGKKGYFWEINPEKKNEVEKEITKWLNEEGRKVVENQHYYQTLTGCFPSPLHARVPLMPYGPSPHGLMPAGTPTPGPSPSPYHHPHHHPSPVAHVTTPIPTPTTHMGPYSHVAHSTPMSIVHSSSLCTPQQILRSPYVQQVQKTFHSPCHHQLCSGCHQGPVFNANELPSEYAGVEGAFTDPGKLSSTLFGFDLNSSEANRPQMSMEDPLGMGVAGEVEVTMGGSDDSGGSPIISQTSPTSYMSLAELNYNQDFKLGPNVTSPLQHQQSLLYRNFASETALSMFTPNSTAFAKLLHTGLFEDSSSDSDASGEESQLGALKKSDQRSLPLGRKRLLQESDKESDREEGERVSKPRKMAKRSATLGRPLVNKGKASATSLGSGAAATKSKSSGGQWRKNLIVKQMSLNKQKKGSNIIPVSASEGDTGAGAGESNSSSSDQSFCLTPPKPSRQEEGGSVLKKLSDNSLKQMERNLNEDRLREATGSSPDINHKIVCDSECLCFSFASQGSTGSSSTATVPLLGMGRSAGTQQDGEDEDTSVLASLTTDKEEDLEADQLAEIARELHVESALVNELNEKECSDILSV